MCDMTRSHVWHDLFTCVTWLIHMCDMTRSHVWHDSFTCVTWLVHMYDMTHSHVWRDSCAGLWVCSNDMTHSHVWHDVFTLLTWLIHMCDTTHSFEWVCVQHSVEWLWYSFHSCEWVCVENMWMSLLEHCTKVWMSLCGTLCQSLYQSLNESVGTQYHVNEFVWKTCEWVCWNTVPWEWVCVEHCTKVCTKVNESCHINKLKNCTKVIPHCVHTVWNDFGTLFEFIDMARLESGVAD